MTQVRLISITKPAGEGMEDMTAEELISYVARVSNPSNQMNTLTAPKLLAYCIEHAHWSIFEHVSMTVEIETSIAISAQILRHRSACFQQMSRRYSSEKNGYLPMKARSQDKKNRQNSNDDMSEEDNAWFQEAQKKVWDKAYEAYEEALNRGVAKEQARFLLPQNAKTTLYMTNNIRNWIHYIQIRTDPSTQREHREVALAIQKIFISQFPVLANALKWG